jgi:hypothetical protein
MVRRVLGLVLIGLLLAWPSFGWVAAAANACCCWQGWPRRRIRSRPTPLPVVAWPRTRRA